MTIHIPVWIFWVLGVPAVIAILFFAWFGYIMFKDWNR